MSTSGVVGPGRSKAPLVVAVVVGLLLIIGVRSLLHGDSGKPSSTSARAREVCTQLAITASSEKAALLQAVADEFEASGGSADGTCVDVTVTTKASGGAEEALARGWDDQRDGARPDVWSPASSSWAFLLQEALTRADKAPLVPASTPSIARTPLVLALPEPMARALGWPDKDLGWSDVLALTRDPRGWGRYGHSEWGRFVLGKTNPNLSTAGLNATVGAFVAATGRSSDLTARDLKDRKVLDDVRQIESSVAHYGDTTLTFLSNLQRADDAGRGLTYVSAVAVEEKSVWDYNQGNPSGDPASLGKHDKPHVPLAAVYPREGTLFSDNPYVVLTAPWVTDAKKAAAKAFLDYVLTDKAQDRFRGAAFRDHDGKAGSLVSRANGMLPGKPSITLDPPAPAVLAQVRDTWQSLRKRARVLLVLDVSGSMGQSAGAGVTRLDLAKQAASKALGAFSPDDEVGLWVFTTGLGGGNDVYRELAPIAPIGPRIGSLRAKIGGLQPLEGTPLYAVTRRAVSEVRSKLDTKRINAVVLLTDGKNEYPQDEDLDGLVSSLGSESEATQVRVFPIGYSKGADLDALRRIAEASRAALYDASDPASIDKVFTAVVSNF